MATRKAQGAKRAAKKSTRGVEHSAVAERTARFGLLARGVIYCLVAVVAVQVALGRRGQEADREGALQLVARQRFGSVVLGALAIGFLAYAGWRFLKAWTASTEGGKPKDGLTAYAMRAADVARGLLYVSLFASTVKVVMTGRSQGHGDRQAKAWSARLMSVTGGRWTVVLVGIVLVGVGLAWVGQALRQNFVEHLELRRMTATQKQWLPTVGTVGYTGRAAVVALAGAFLVQAAVRFDPEKAVGVDGALHRLAGRPYGPALLIAVAIGLAAFGLFSFVEARWRKVLER